MLSWVADTWVEKRSENPSGIPFYLISQKTIMKLDFPVQ
ncbi:MAG: hypothetical protein A4E64_01751 [Syntrophorhabdus sp. PtaU1.Bin058]|nr:MAG: hypothetical protein A4E64_01751 [Syntrophorhabdus sp. PtaU1.Bin058]